MRKRLLTMVMLFVMAMVSIPCIGEMTGGKFGTVEAEAATKKATNKKAKKLYQKKIQQIIDESYTSIYYKYADINRDGITDVMISGRAGSSWELQIYTYNKGKLVQLYEERIRGAHGVKVIGYKGGFVVHFYGIGYYDEIGFDEYIYFKKISARKYKEVAIKTQCEDYDYGEWDYYAISGSSWKESQRAFDKQVKKIKTGTRKYYGSCYDWTYKSK